MQNIEKFRKTKIICTLGPATSDINMIRKLADAGMNIARLNMSHGDHKFHGDLIQKIKKLNKDLKYPIAIMIDTQRPANTVGLVIERKRDEKELDGFQWYCDNCGEKLYEEFVKLTNIVTQLPPIFEKYWGDESKRTCKKCGTVMQKP